jgi:hypothetical protein
LTKRNITRKKSISSKLEYINALLLTGEFDTASMKLSAINPTKIYSISEYVNYYIIKNNLSFYLKNIDELQKLKHTLESLSYKRKSINRKIEKLKESNLAYIDCLKGNLDYKLYMEKKKKTTIFNISKVSAAYVAYLASEHDREYHTKCKNFIVRYGGTCFFKEIVESVKK